MRPAVSVRSDANLGAEKSLESVLTSRSSRLNEFLEWSVPLTGALLALLGLLAIIVVKRSGLANAVSSDKNNAGFLLLHHGFVDDATAVLSSALHSGRYDAFTLSNLAVCKALKGEHEQAKQLLRAASFRQRYGHVKAVILFNEALIGLITGNKDEAIAKSPTHIRRYCQRSVHFDAVRNDPAIYDLIKDA